MERGEERLAIRTADLADVGALARLRALWFGGQEPLGALERRLADWISAEGERRTLWPAAQGEDPIGMASMLEYRRMPRPDRQDSRWGYIGNMFVRAEWRDQGVGSELLAAIVASAEQRGYARLVVAPSERAMSLYGRAGFLPADGRGADALMVRPRRSS